MKLPDWISYDATNDEITIHGKRYSAAMFGPTGFAAPVGTLLMVVEGHADVVTLLTVKNQGALDVLNERRRQISDEGWTAAHDDEHRAGDLAIAASCYALFSESRPIAGSPPESWPWAAEWWKPKGARAGLVRAGALILAEIDRLDRHAALVAPPGLEPGSAP